MGTAEFERDGSLVTVVLDGQPQSAVDVDDPTRLDFEYVQHFALAIDALAGDGPLRVVQGEAELLVQLELRVTGRHAPTLRRRRDVDNHLASV